MDIKLRILMIVILVNNPHNGNAISCYVCDTSSNDDCNPGTSTTCGSEQICMNEVREENGLFIVRKMCKETDACQSQENQNPFQCHPGENVISLCFYCCNVDLCNSGNYLDVTSAIITTLGTTQLLLDPTTRAVTSSLATTVPPDPTTQALTEASPDPTTQALTEASPVPTTQALTEASPDPTTQALTEASPDPTTQVTTVASLDPSTLSSASSVMQPLLVSQDSSTQVVQTTINPSQEANCNADWNSASTYFIVTDTHHTIHSADMMDTTPARSRVACSLKCLHQNNCGFFAFNNVTLVCVLGRGIYESSKVQVQPGSTVFLRL
ncbi:threonine-rich protein-like isoform X2 [Acanthaster planci]|nr:threonine-rich protein-like isoform X2 [Acanthaster planci]